MEVRLPITFHSKGFLCSRKNWQKKHTLEGTPSMVDVFLDIPMASRICQQTDWIREKTVSRDLGRVVEIATSTLHMV